MELLQEAGFHPLEVIRGATLHGAQALYEPKGKPIEFGVVRPGLLADLDHRAGGSDRRTSRCSTARAPCA